MPEVDERRVRTGSPLRPVESAGHVLRLGRPHEELYRRLVSSELLFEQPDEAAFERHARELLVPPGLEPAAPEFAAYWSSIVHHVYADVLGVDEVFANRVVRDHALRMMAAAALVVFPIDPDALPDSLPATVRRARWFIEHNADHQIAVADIAAEARLTPRGLQQAFRRHLGVTPTQYLRALRLAAVHEDLLAGDPAAGDTVETIASRRGFTHLPRFAAAYRATFGETPSTTLRS